MREELRSCWRTRAFADLSVVMIQLCGRFLCLWFVFHCSFGCSCRVRTTTQFSVFLFSLKKYYIYLVYLLFFGIILCGFCFYAQKNLSHSGTNSSLFLSDFFFFFALFVVFFFFVTLHAHTWTCNFSVSAFFVKISVIHFALFQQKSKNSNNNNNHNQKRIAHDEANGMKVIET